MDPSTGTSVESHNTQLNGKASMLCCDPNGLCLGTRGDDINADQSGLYTSLIRLASQLSGVASSSSHSSSSSAISPSTASPSIQNSSVNAVSDVSRTNHSLLVSIETNRFSTLIKEYDAHTVVLRVPHVPSEGKDTNTIELGEKGDLKPNVDESTVTDVSSVDFNTK